MNSSPQRINEALINTREERLDNLTRLFKNDQDKVMKANAAIEQLTELAEDAVIAIGMEVAAGTTGAHVMFQGRMQFTEQVADYSYQMLANNGYGG